ncbi:MAG: SDR family NAD(P)-dependent oxidoreductase [Flavobacteriaceae bacterium]|nr:SDR family NAD(P)-dependent oxidoreductase [Flavobacteriaceae bacterium]
MKNILIIGAQQGIGQGLYQKLKNTTDNFILTSRKYSPYLINQGNTWKIKCDLSKIQSIDNFSKEIYKKFSHIDYLINCAGVLHTTSYLPEKSVSRLNTIQMIESFHTNAIGHLLLLKNLEKIISRSDNSIAVSISARIGSIKDNHLGGWYSYRMSKAALNMGIKTLQIEWKRKYPQVKLLLIHPGTTDTNLSKPFQKSMKEGMLQTVEHTSNCLIRQIDDTFNEKQNNLFIDYNGDPIQW